MGSSDVAGSRTLVIVYDISQMISSAVVSLTDAHGVVCEVHITVVACRRSVCAVLKLSTRWESSWELRDWYLQKTIITVSRVYRNGRGTQNLHLGMVVVLTLNSS
jgi:hypothetical protein